jgi:nitrile hydratase accessory protein
MGSIDPDDARRATEAVPTIPRDTQGPVFREPWEANAFDLALSLHDKGLFTWTEWAAMLGDEIRKAQAAGDPDTGTTYYRHWMATQTPYHPRNQWVCGRAHPRRARCGFRASAAPTCPPPCGGQAELGDPATARPRPQE